MARQELYIAVSCFFFLEVGCRLISEFRVCNGFDQMRRGFTLVDINKRSYRLGSRTCIKDSIGRTGASKTREGFGIKVPAHDGVRQRSVAGNK